MEVETLNSHHMIFHIPSEPQDSVLSSGSTFSFVLLNRYNTRLDAETPLFPKDSCGIFENEGEAIIFPKDKHGPAQPALKHSLNSLLTGNPQHWLGITLQLHCGKKTLYFAPIWNETQKTCLK